ncbi:hypothetical protein CDAR_318881, partial [Caerostris darwini]
EYTIPSNVGILLSHVLGEACPECVPDLGAFLPFSPGDRQQGGERKNNFRAVKRKTGNGKRLLPPALRGVFCRRGLHRRDLLRLQTTFLEYLGYR